MKTKIAKFLVNLSISHWGHCSSGDTQPRPTGHCY